MATNPLFRNEVFFTSGMYDDVLVNKLYPTISSESYDRSKQIQQNLLDRRITSTSSNLISVSLVSEFEVVPEFNTYVNVPVGSYRIKINNLSIPYYDKLKFIRKYSTVSRQIPIIDTFINKEIFNKAIYVYIGQYRCVKGYIMEDRDSSLYYVLPNHNTEGVLSADMERAIASMDPNDKVIITVQEQSSYYTYTNLFSRMISGSIGVNNSIIQVPYSALKNSLGKSVNHERSSMCDCLITYSSSYGQNILTSTVARQIEPSATGYRFSIDNRCVNDIRNRNSSVTITFIENPNISEVDGYLYVAPEDDSFVDIFYKSNPTPNINLEIFEFDILTAQKGRKLFDRDLVQIHYPNIYDFRDLNSNRNPLLIEIREYDESYTNQEMYDALKPLISTIGVDKYSSLIEDNKLVFTDTSTPFNSYEPKSFLMDNTDYQNSEYFDNVRGYMMDKVFKTFDTDSSLYRKYLKNVKDVNNYSTTISGYPNTIGFGGLDDLGDLFKGINRVVMDTSTTSINDDDIEYFTEPHSYISYYSRSKEVPANVYINGTYTPSSTIRYYKNMMYYYYPVSLIKGLLQPLADSINTLSLQSPADCIHVDIFDTSYDKYIDTISEAYQISALDQELRIFQNQYYKLNDILAYDTITGEYINILEVFNIIISVSQTKIDTLNPDEIIFNEAKEGIDYFLTSLSEYYVTNDGYRIVLPGSALDIDTDAFYQDLVDKGIFPDIESAKRGFINKIINFSDVRLVAKTSSLVGKNITFKIAKFKESQTIEVSRDDIQYTADTNKPYVVFTGMSYSPNIGRYLSFDNSGRHLVDIDTDNDSIINNIIPDNYINGNVTMLIPSSYTIEDTNRFTLVYNPIEYYTSLSMIDMKSMTVDTEDKLSMNELFYNTNMDGTNIKELFPYRTLEDILINKGYGYLISSNDSNIDQLDNSICKFTYSTDVNVINGNRIPTAKTDIGSLYHTIYNYDEIISIFSDYIPTIGSKIYVIEKYESTDYPLYRIADSISLMDKLIGEIIS